MMKLVFGAISFIFLFRSEGHLIKKTIPDSPVREIICQCGTTSKTFSLVVQNLDDRNSTELCDEYKYCASCKSGRSECVACEVGRYGPLCNEVKIFEVPKIRRTRRAKRATPPCIKASPPKPGRVRCISNLQKIECTGTCESGYKFPSGQSDMTVTCYHDDGRWTPSNSFPDCQPICQQRCQNGGQCVARNQCYCPDNYRGETCQYSLSNCNLQTVTAGAWKCNHTEIRSTCRVTCDALSSIHHCNMEGIWSPSLPACVTSVARSSTSTVAHRPQSERPEQNQRVTPVPEPAVDQQRVMCRDPGTVDNADRFVYYNEGQIRDRYPPGTYLVFYCKEGYSTTDQTSLLCQTDGIWDEDLPACDPPALPSTCRYPPLLRNGYSDPYRQPGDEFTAGSSLNYICNPGFILTGTRTITCRSDGSWSGSPPTCVSDHGDHTSCPDPGPLENGYSEQQQPDSFAPGSSITYRCNPPFYISGDSTITCSSDGTWSSSKPQCIQVSTCPKPPFPANGFVSLLIPAQVIGLSSRNKNTSITANIPEDLYPTDTKVQYKCRSKYYEIVGSEIRTCLPTGNWSGNLATCIQICGQSDWPRQPNIVNGQATDIGQWPWQVAISEKGLSVSREWTIICGGALLNDRWIITAAHCVTRRFTTILVDKSKLRFYLGKYYRDDDKDDENIQISTATHLYVNPRYNPRTFDSDIALVHLESAIELTSRVQPVCLPDAISARENLSEGKRGVVTGWGLTENKTDSPTLLQAEIPYVSRTRCEEGYSKARSPLSVTENMFCGGYEEGKADACSGDSGGPMVFYDSYSRKHRWILEGIVSWGSASGCGKQYQYGGYTMVSSYMEWIKQYT